MNNSSTLFSVINFIAQALKQGQKIFTDYNEFQSFMLQLGWPVGSLPTSYQAFAQDIEILLEDLQALPPDASLEDILALLTDVASLYASLKNIIDTPIGISPADINTFKSEFGVRLIENLLGYYINKQYPIVYSILASFQVFESEFIQATATRPAYVRRHINYDRLGNVISDPLGALKDFFGWNSSFIFGQLVYLIYELLTGLNVKATIGKGDQGLPALYSGTAENDLLRFPLKLSALLLPVRINNDFYDITLDLIEYRDNNPLRNGFILQVSIPSAFSLNTKITDKLTLTINANAAIGNLFGILVSTSGVTFKYPFQNGSIPASGIAINLLYQPDKPYLLLGSTAGTNLNIKRAGLLFGLEYKDDFEVFVEADLSGLSLNIQPGESDNFIKKILGDQPKEINFPITIRWSSKHGISFKGSGSFEFNVNMHFKLGPIEFNDIKVAIRAPQGQSKVKVDIGTNIKGDLGVIAFNVDNIGLGLTLGLHEGNAGPFDIKLGFKPPTGIGVAINASAVKGGGFLNYDEATWTYTGGLELAFSKISFSAIGIVSTKLPGGKPGYALLIIISAEFTPIQLGMGFTLNGIGGILGLNRTMNPDVLRTGIRDNTLDSILFPKDIVKNANTIISNIGQAFPTKEGQFLVGPMAKIGWGTPTLLTIELGIIIELPEPVRLAILGVIKALLPSKENAIVKIQVNFLGIIDFTNKYLSFDASLYDSQILTFGLFGDMALRLYWGDKPNFLLSVGGFHPKFTPPPLNLPQLRRLTIVLANQNNLKISVETYFAVTSNSVQFGAKVAAMAKAWKIEAIGALWFDILFQFSPFYFIADMGVMFAIKMGSKTILSLYVNLTLEGPNPWRARGKGSFKVLFVKVNVSFDKTFGQARIEAIQAEAIDAKVKAALTNRDNWEALLPERSHQLISWREEDLSDPNTELSVDPAGILKISQRLIPLTTTMTKFGSSAISDYNRYEVTDVKAGMDSLPRQMVQDYFARNEFFYMKDDEKLSRPSYELFDSGVAAGADRIDSQYAVHKKFHYEEITLDSGYRRPEPIFFLSLDQFHLHAFGNYISRSGLSSFDRITTSAGPNRVKVDLQEEQFVLINRNDMSEVSGYFNNSLDAEQYLSAEMLTAPATAADWIVANRFEL